MPNEQHDVRPRGQPPRRPNVPYFAGHGGVTSPDGYTTTPTPAGWRPDLVKGDTRVILAYLLRF